MLANDTDIDGGPKTVTAVVQPANGTVTYTETTASYTPNANYNGTDTFSYTLNGGSTATVTVTVTAVDDAPVALNDGVGYISPGDGTVNVPVLSNDINPDNKPLTITAYTQPANGTVTVIANRVTYTPKPDFYASDTFTYTINGISTATVTITRVRNF